MGILYVVSTPIGNLEDITLRAINILLNTPVIACEDTRHTGNLIKSLKDKFGFGIGHKYLSVRDWNEAQMVTKVMEELQLGDVALVSDAGTPLVSDPGFKVVREALKLGHKVVPVPGPSAMLAALVASGLPTNKFMFWGFLPKKWIFEPELTNIIYESPLRVEKTANEIRSRYPEAQLVFAQEITKVFEHIGTSFNPGKGEVVVLVYIPKPARIQ